MYFMFLVLCFCYVFCYICIYVFIQFSFSNCGTSKSNCLFQVSKATYLKVFYLLLICFYIIIFIYTLDFLICIRFSSILFYLFYFVLFYFLVTENQFLIVFIFTLRKCVQSLKTDLNNVSNNSPRHKVCDQKSEISI